MPFEENPPTLTTEKLDERFLSLWASPEVRRMVRAANDRYLHWDHFRRRPVPLGLSHETAWLYIVLARTGNRKVVPFSDKGGNPFSYWVPDSVFKALNSIDKWSGGVLTKDTLGPLTPKEKDVISSLMEEAIASSQLEGAATTRKVAKEMLRSGRPPRDKNERMIVNNYLTMQHVREMRGAQLTPEGLCEIQGLVTEGTLEDPHEAGRLRTRDDIVVQYRGETVHVPPKADSLPARIDALCAFANHDETEDWIHPVLKAIVIHFWLAYDHPFTDGNGRTARALMYWYLLSRGYLFFEYLAVSRYFLQSPGQYVRSYLYTETDQGDLTYFMTYNLKAIQLAFEDLRKYLERKQQEVSTSNRMLKDYRGLNVRQKTLLYHALHHPDASYTIQAHKIMHGVVYQTARNDLLDLARKGLLRKEKQGKEFVFLPSSRITDKLRREAKNHARLQSRATRV